MKTLVKAVAACAVMMVSSIAYAIPVTYSFSGSCTWGCGNLGLSNGDPVGGSIVAGDGFADDWVLYGSELSDFDLDFGSVNIAYATHSAAGAFGLNPDLSFNTLFGGLTFQNSETGATTGSITVPFLGSLSGWIAHADTWEWCGRRGCASIPTKIGKGPGSYHQAVPEPATLALLGVGLLGLGLSGWRRRRD